MRPYIIWWAIAVHIAWGIALLVDPTIPPAAILVGLHWIVALGVDGQVLGVVLIVAALCAVVGLYLNHRLSSRLSLLMLMPQYGFLLAALLSDTQSIVEGRVADRQVDRLLLFTVLWPVIVAAVLHSLAIIERHISWNRAQ